MCFPRAMRHTSLALVAHPIDGIECCPPNTHMGFRLARRRGLDVRAVSTLGKKPISHRVDSLMFRPVLARHHRSAATRGSTIVSLATSLQLTPRFGFTTPSACGDASVFLFAARFI